MQLNYNKQSLLEKIASGTKLKYLFFWGHTQKNPNIIAAECLSQWYPAEFTIDNIQYLTAEHYMRRKRRVYLRIITV